MKRFRSSVLLRSNKPRCHSSSLAISRLHVSDPAIVPQPCLRKRDDTTRTEDSSSSTLSSQRSDRDLAPKWFQVLSRRSLKRQGTPSVRFNERKNEYFHGRQALTEEEREKVWYSEEEVDEMIQSNSSSLCRLFDDMDMEMAQDTRFSN